MGGMDATFAELLTATATIARPRVELDGDGGPKTPTFAPTGQSVRVRITPSRCASEDDLLGRTEDVTYVIYAESADIRMGDRMVTRPVTTLLSEEIEAGATVLPVVPAAGIRDGQTVEIGGEERLVTEVTDGRITVKPMVTFAHEEGETVSVLASYEVLTVEDAAGMGHHLRLTAVGDNGARR